MIIKYPKDLKRNLEYRRDILTATRDNPQKQLFYKDLCRRDRLAWINLFVWTFDPRRMDMTTVPFITYKFQDELLLWDVRCCEKSMDNLVEKSRDMGVTWCLIANDVYDWRYSDEQMEIKWGSRNQDYVDKRGEMDSVFEKIRFLLKNLPKWMLPDRFDWGKHDNFMRLLNPETGSALTGEATSQNFGRGGRKKRIRFDEFAVWDCDVSAWQASADTTNCRTALSTVNGSANKFAELAHSKIEKMTLHWTQHPKKNPGVYRLGLNNEQIPISIEDNPDAAFEIWKDCRDIVPPQGLIGGIIRSPWYDAECERRANNKEIAEELDIDYLRSGSPFFDNRAVKAQQVWKQLIRDNFMGKIPSGHFVRGNIIELSGQYTFKDNLNGWLKVYEMPVRQGQYVVGGDVAEGLPKGDESVLVVREKHTRNVVAVCNGLYTPELLAQYAQKVGQFYNKALVAVENNNHGYTSNEILGNLDCNLYWTIRKGKDGTRVKVKRGWSTTAQSRPLMLDNAAEEVAKIICEVRDADILGQMLTFVHNEKTGKPEADGNFKDDTILAFAIAGQVINEHPYKTPRQEVPFDVRERYQPSNAGFGF